MLSYGRKIWRCHIYVFAKALAGQGANIVLLARRLEMPSDVRKSIEMLGVQCIAMKAQTLPKFKDVMIHNCPMGRQGTEEELMSTVVYLASKESSYTNGVTIPVDGGWTAV